LPAASQYSQVVSPVGRLHPAAGQHGLDPQGKELAQVQRPAAEQVQRSWRPWPESQVLHGAAEGSQAQLVRIGSQLSGTHVVAATPPVPEPPPAPPRPAPP